MRNVQSAMRKFSLSVILDVFIYKLYEQQTRSLHSQVVCSENDRQEIMKSWVI